MGHAAYMRGSVSISRGNCRAYGCRGCVYCHEAPKPTPRPANWGSKARAKALKKARGVVAWCKYREQPPPSEEALADMVQYDTKIGRETAESAARSALGGVA